ncbi:MAG: hypothetical protein IKF41_03965 [Alphaproteobacteria bacterium]|nr:hypothetical protein [Alphaproteobacteria bacterium]
MLAVVNLTDERKSTMKRVGSSGEPIVFTKDDFLTKRFLATKFKVSTELAEKTMKKMQLAKAKIMVNGHPAPVVIQYKSKTPRVHPMGLDIFQEYLNKEKEKQ